jgi:hypothetical protein
MVEHGVNDWGVVPNPSESNPLYALSLTCEDGNWACKKKNGKSERKHVVEVDGMVEM